MQRHVLPELCICGRHETEEVQAGEQLVSMRTSRMVSS